MSRKLGRLGILFSFVIMLTPISLVLADYRFDISPNGTVTDDTILNVYVKADFQARTWLDIQGTEHSNPHFNDFGGPEHTSTIKTNEWGLGTLKICSVAQRDGQSEQQAQSEERCQSVTVISSGNSSPGQSTPQTGGADFTGFCKNSKNLDRVGGNPANAYDLLCAGGDQEVRFTVSEVCAWQYGGALPYPGLSNAGDRNMWTCNAHETYVAPENVNPNNGGSDNNNNNSNSNNGNNNQNNSQQDNGGGNNNPPQQSSGGSCISNQVSVGGQAVVLPGDPNNVRSSPSKTASFVTKMSAGSRFLVTGGPECGDGLIWWQVNFNGAIGWTAEGDSSGKWIQSVSDGQAPAASGQGASNQNSGQSSDAACNTPAPFVVGNLGKVLPGPKNNVRSEAKTSASIAFQMEQGSVFTVIGGPTCASGFRWWLISYNGQNGWTAEGTASENWIAYAGEGGQSQQPSSTQNLIITVQLVDGSWFNFVYDSSNELILNGDEFVVSELQKLKNKLSGENIDLQRTIFYLYAVPIGGSSNKNKDLVINAVCKQSVNGFDACKSRIKYTVGEKHMDLSGVGNIAYGYFMTDLGFDLFWQNGIANTDQTLASLQAKEGWRFTDNPDDIAQRNVGLALSKLNLSTFNLDDVARTQGLY